MADEHPHAEELTSWKEIADHLGVTVRTAQNWEKKHGLPVQRLPGERGRILAYAEKLERWKVTGLEPRPPLPTQKYRYSYYAAAAVLGGLAVFFGMLYLLVERKGAPAKFRTEFKELLVTDDGDREVWRKRFEDGFDPGHSPGNMIAQGTAWFGDLDGDRHVELLFDHVGNPKERDGSTLFCLSDRGTEKWRFVAGREVTTGDGVYSRPYLVSQLHVLPAIKGRGMITVLVSHHISFYPTQVVALSDKGELFGEYWHAGQFPRGDVADVDGDGVPELLLGGTSNAYKAATLVILNPYDLGGASVEGETNHQIQGFGPGKEKARILFPRSCINLKLDQLNMVNVVAFHGNDIHVSVVEHELRNTVTVDYHLNRNLEVTSVDVSDQFRNLHRELELSHQLDHQLTEREISDLRKIRALRPAAAGARF